jgi:cysteine desulfurase/selenocysteine lyase
MIELLDAVELEEIRDDFPILSQKVHGKPLVHFDNAATSQKPRQVIDSTTTTAPTLPSTVDPCLAERSTRIPGAPAKVVRFINALAETKSLHPRHDRGHQPRRYSWARHNLKKGDEILITWMEHHSNIVPWYQVCEQTAPSSNASNQTSTARSLYRHQPRTAGRRHPLPNVLGTINPVRQFADAPTQSRRAYPRRRRAKHPGTTVDVQALDADFYVFSGYKMCGPTASGIPAANAFLSHAAVHGRRRNDWEVNTAPRPTISPQRPHAQDAVHGLRVAVDYLQHIGLRKSATREEITQYALAGSKTSVKFHGRSTPRNRRPRRFHLQRYSLARSRDVLRPGRHRHPCSTTARCRYKHLGIAATAARVSTSTHPRRSTPSRRAQESQHFFGARETGRALGF